jgi:hypothetical protein
MGELCPHVPLQELYWRDLNKGEYPETQDGFSIDMLFLMNMKAPSTAEPPDAANFQDQDITLLMGYLCEYDDKSTWRCSSGQSTWKLCNSNPLGKPGFTGDWTTFIEMPHSETHLNAFRFWIPARYLLPCAVCGNMKLVDSVRGRFCI